MRRILRLFFRDHAPPPPPGWVLSAGQHRQLLDLLGEIGLSIVNEHRGPVPLITFGRCVLERLDMSASSRALLDRPPVPLPHFADALKRVIRDMDHDRLRVLSPTDCTGVGYVYNARDPETWPIKSAC